MKKVVLLVLTNVLASPVVPAVAAPPPPQPQTAITEAVITQAVRTQAVKTKIDKVQAKKDAQTLQIVIDYVRGARGWMDGSYKVSFEKKEGDLLIYYIDYIDGDSASTLVTGEGNSFWVAVNPATKKVERELY